MDIRKYFSPAGGSKNKPSIFPKDSKKKNRIIDSDDEDPLPSSNKKQKILASDSDDDLFQPKNIKKSSKSKKVEKTKKSLPKPETPKLKPSSVSAFFGSSPVVRQEAPVVALKKKVEEISDVHSDDDFEKTLQELDKEQNKPKPLSQNEGKSKHDKKEENMSTKHKRDEETPKKETPDLKLQSHNDEKPKPNENSPPNSKGGLASKLSAKIKNSSKDIDHKDTKEKMNEVTPRKEKHKHRDEEERSHSHEKKRKHSDHDKDRKNDCTPDKLESSHKKQKMSPDKERSSKKDDKKSPKKEKHSEKDKIPNKDKKHTSSSKESDKKGSKSEIEVEQENKSPAKENEDSLVETPNPEEKKKAARGAYFKYLQRSGPSNPGSKPIPEGAPNCLQGLVFVPTGVLDSLDREETAELIKKYGGKVTSSLSRNTTYLLVGNDPGESKLNKAEKLGTKHLTEDELLELIRTRPGKGGAKIESEKEKTPTTKKLQAFERNLKESSGQRSITSSPLSQKQSSSGKLLPEDTTTLKKGVSLFNSQKSLASSQNSEGSQVGGSQSSSIGSPKTQSLSSQEVKDRSGQTLMWVDKYKPASIKNIIGQQGDKSHVKKLLNWLKNWKNNQSGDKKLVRPSPWAKDDNGAFFKCALLSGPPGVGKTTTAHLVCKEAGFDFVELNASDARSKRKLDEVVSELLSNKSLAGFAGGKKTSENHALVMDEVDGMSGNEDRGGVQELIALIKKSKIPIITMCNDRNHPKIRSLANHCFDLRFNKPRIEQIRGPMMSVCFREGIKIKPEALDQIIMGANQDVRQVLHHISVWSANQTNLAADDMKKEAEKAKKNFKMGPWDVCKKVFTEAEHKNMSLYDKSDLFFHDYSIGPLFVQENYPKCVPHVAKGNRSMTLEQLSKTAECIADGDLCERAIRSKNAWALLPVQAMYSSVIPGDYMSGHMAMQIEFPKWLGHNSRRNKYDRLMQELQKHMRLKISGSKLDVNMDYSEPLKNALTMPLVKNGMEGVSSAVDVMNTYHLLREDLDSLLELTQWPGSRDPMSKVESKVKAAFTRMYNKEGHLTPFAAVTVAKKKKGAATTGDMYGDEEEESASDDDNDDISKNAMIKVKKAGGKKDEAGTTKGKGRGGGSTSTKGSTSSRGKGRGKK